MFLTLQIPRNYQDAQTAHARHELVSACFANECSSAADVFRTGKWARTSCQPSPTREPRYRGSGVGRVNRLTRFPSGSRNIADRLPQGIVVGSRTMTSSAA